MTIETEVASLTQATTDLLSAVNVKKAALDAAEANAVNALDSFESQYIGARSSAPATDADGDPVQTGALYYNTTNTTMYVYSGSAWDALVDNLVIDPNATMLSNIATNGNDIKFGDNDKATFGASDDLQIYHDGTKNRVVGSVDVTGTITADGLTVDGELDVNAVGVVNIGTRADMFFDIDSNNDQTNRQLGITSDNGVRRLFTAVEGGDVLFYEDTGTTAKMVWDASAESLISGGSHTASNARFVATGVNAGDGLAILNDSSNGVLMGMSGSSATESFVINKLGSGNAVDFSIDPAGNVGIGTAIPSAKLEVTGAANSKVAEFTSVGGETRGLAISTFSSGGFDSTGVNFNTQSTVGAFSFSTGSTERARIDSSGNLLVGTTSTSVGYGSTDAGIALRGKSGSLFSRDNSFAISANRNGNDGDIMEFHKDGAKVGSIGTEFTELTINAGGVGKSVVFAGSNGSVDTKIAFAPTAGTESFRPYNADSDALFDLGRSDRRFKDLYLSGGVYLGGTGAVNKLDDYEEGTWTPVFSSTSATITQGILRGSYTKIGDLVTASAYIQITSIAGTLTNTIKLTGLPFTYKDRDGHSGAFGVEQFSSRPTIFMNNIGDNYVTIYKAGTTTEMKASDINVGYYLMSISYTA